MSIPITSTPVKPSRFLFLFGFGGMLSLLAAAGLYLHEPLLGLVFASAVLHTAPFWVSWVKGKRTDIFEPIYFCLLSSFVLFVVKPLFYYFVLDMRIVLITREFQAGSVMGLVMRSELYAILGLTALYLGYYSGAARRGARHVPRPPSVWPRSRVNVSLLLLAAVSFTSIGIFSLKTGMLNLSAAGSPGRGFLFHGYNVLYRVGTACISITFMLWVAARGRQLRGYKVIFVMGLVVVYLSLFLSRTPIIALFVTLLVFRHYYVKKISPGTLGVVAIAILLLSFSLLYLRTGHAFRDKLSAGPAVTFLDKNMFSDKAFLLILEESPHNIPYRYGSSIVNSLMFFIPRALFPDKPLDVANQINWQYFGKKSSGFNITFLGDLYINFQLPGILAGMYILGFFAGVLKHYRVLHRDNRGVVLIYAASCFWLFDLIFKNLWHFWSGLTWNVVLLALVIFQFKIRFGIQPRKTVIPTQ